MVNVKLLTAILRYLFKVAPFWSVMIVISTFLQLSNIKPTQVAVHKQVKNEQLTLKSQRKLAFTGRYMLMAL
jgi:hypothetical protein